MSELVRIGDGWSDAQKCSDLVFVHGLGGSSDRTWADRDGVSWCRWIASDLPQVRVSALNYEAEASEWFGHTMPLADRATNLLALLKINGLGQLPICFIAHSLGGLVVKQALRNASGAAPEYKHICKATKGALFLSTPHSGAGLADFVWTLLRVLGRASRSVEELRAHEPHLRELNLWYRNSVRRLSIKTGVLYERLPTYKVLVVNPTTADPGIPGVTPICVDYDHFGIARADSQSSFVYRFALDFTKQLFLKRSLPIRSMDPACPERCRARISELHRELFVTAPSELRQLRYRAEALVDRCPPQCEGHELLDRVTGAITRSQQVTPGPFGPLL
jgi:pimeloyl-ACP methyl ester carboxylesterase